MVENAITSDLKDNSQAVAKDRKLSLAANYSLAAYQEKSALKNFVKCSLSLVIWQIVLFQLMTVGLTEDLAS